MMEKSEFTCLCSNLFWLISLWCVQINDNGCYIMHMLVVMSRLPCSFSVSG